MDNQPQNDSNAASRRSIYGILICIGLGAMIGRILAVDSVDFRRLADTKFKKQLDDKRSELQGQGLTALEIDYAVQREETRLALQSGLWRPFLSANDRSRWCTVRALVEPDMQVPGAPYAIDKVIDRKTSPGWDTIDKVRRNDHFYSSKPPLLSTLMAAEYWVIYHATGKSLGTHPYEIGRFMLITINGACLLLRFHLHGPARRAVGHDRLGTDPGDGELRIRHLPGDVRDHDNQSSAGSGVYGGAAWMPSCESGSTEIAARGHSSSPDSSARCWRPTRSPRRPFPRR